MKPRLALILSAAVLTLASLAHAGDVIRSWQFNTPGDTEGWISRSTWTLPQGIDVALDVDGVETVLTSGDIAGNGDCGIVFDAAADPIALPAEYDEWDSLSIRLRHLDANPPEGLPVAYTGGAALWITGTGGVLGTLPAVSSGLWRVEAQDDNWAVYTVNLKGDGGAITNIRFDPYSGLDGNFEIDWIELTANTGEPPRGPMNLYVDINAGDDLSGDGSVGNPWRSLDRAWPELIDGDTLILAEGAYPAFSNVADSAGGWDLFGDWVTVRPAEGADVSIEQLSLTYSGVLPEPYNAYLRFENIHFLNGIRVVAAAHLAFVDCLIETFPPWTGSAEIIDGNKAVSFGGVRDFLMQGCEITNTTLGIEGGGREIRILDNHIHDIAHDGIRVVGWKDSLIQGNRIHGVDDGVTDDEEPWSRHCDIIHLFIAGPGTPGMENSNIVVRDNVLYDAESQIIQINNYLKSDLRSDHFLWENNIFGPSNANLFNCAGGVDGLVFRHNSIIAFETPRTYGRWTMDNYTFRVGGGSTGVQIYNNILYSGTPQEGCQVDFFDYNIYQDVNVVQPEGVDGTRAFGKFTLQNTDVLYANPGAFDGALDPASPAINYGTRAFAPTPLHETDIAGTPRDLRPDVGAWEYPGLAPSVEPLPPTESTDPVTVFVDDFADGAYTDVDPWLNAPGRQGMSWWRPDPAPFKFKVQSSGYFGGNALYDPRGDDIDTRIAWLFSEQGDDWADYDFSFDVGNQYLGIGTGVLLLAQGTENAYWLEVSRDRGRLVRYLDGVQTELASAPAIQMPHTGVRLYKVMVRHENDGAITIACDADRDGGVDFTCTDDEPAAIARFAAGGVGFHNNDVVDIYHTAVYDNLRVEVLTFAAVGVPGDANGDGSVDIQDFVILKQNYGMTSGATSAQGDFNGDGAVDIQDFVLLKQNYGS